MSEEEFDDEESLRLYESSDSEIDSDLEGALYSQLHYSVSLPSQEQLDENDEGVSTPSAGSIQLPDAKEDIKENTADYVINITSDSDDDSGGGIEYFMKGEDEDNDEDKKKSTYSVQENWSLIRKDLQGNILADGKRRVALRYYKGQTKIRCNNCNERGHKAVDCPTPKKTSCFLCGGEHKRRYCPNELCFNCHEPGHRAMNCRQPKTRPHDQCSRCFMFGHNFRNCPDRWRQYHRTTESRKLPVPDRSDEFSGPVYCYNCSEKGHYGHECTDDRMDCYVSPSYPVVVKYDGGSEHRDRDNQTNNKQENNRERTSTAGQYRERKHFNKSRTEKPRDKQRKSWSNRSYIDDTSTAVQPKTDIYHNTDRFKKRIGEKVKIRHRTKEQRNPGSSNGECAELKIGSKRKQYGTPHHEQEYKMNKPKNIKNDKHSTSPSKFNGLSKSFTRMVEEWEEMNAFPASNRHRHLHSSPGNTHRHLHSFKDRQSSQHVKTHTKKTFRGFRSKNN